MKKHAVLILIISLVFSACRDEEYITVEKKLPEFENLWLHDAFHVILVQDTVSKVVITGIESIVEGIETRFSEDTVFFANHADGQWLKPEDNTPRLRIHSRNYTALVANQTCYIETRDTIHTELLSLTHQSKLNEADIIVHTRRFVYSSWPSCGGKTTVAGITQKAFVRTRGLMQFDASALKSETIDVLQSGKVDCHVRADESIVYSIRNVGNIYLYGTPSEIIPEEVISSGKLIHAGH